MSNRTGYARTAVQGVDPCGAGLPAPAERLWREHGWGLSWRAVAVVVGAILAVSWAAQLLG